MNRGVLFLSVCFLGVVSLPACGDKGNGEASSFEAEERGLLKALIDEHYSACRAGDLDRIFATFTAEMVGNFEQQMAQLGENPRETMSSSYKASYDNVEHKILGVNLGLPEYQGEAYGRVIVEVKRNVPGAAPSAGDAAPNEDQISFLVVKRNGTWVIASVMSRHQQEAGKKGAEAAGE